MKLPRLVPAGSALAIALVGTAALTSVALAWQGWVQGKPHQLGEGATGYFVYHNDDGWRLRTHDSPSGKTFSGRLHTDGEFVDVSLVRAESTEELAIDDGGHTIRFRFRTFNHIDGLDFRVNGGTRVRFNLQTNGAQTPTGDIWVGHDGLHPPHNPFVIRRFGRNTNDNDDGEGTGGTATTRSAGDARTALPTATPTGGASSGGSAPSSRR